MYFYLLKIPNKIPFFVVLGLQLTVQWSKVYLRNRTHGSIKHVMITLDVKILRFKTTIKKWLHNAILWSRFSGIAKGGFQGFQNPPWATAWAIISRGTRFKVLKKMRKKSIEKSIKFYFEGYIWILWGWSYMYKAPVCIQACKVGFSTLLYML